MIIDSHHLAMMVLKNVLAHVMLCLRFQSTTSFVRLPNFFLMGFNSASAGGIDHVRVHPKFLHSNATSHKWALGGKICNYCLLGIVISEIELRAITSLNKGDIYRILIQLRVRAGFIS